MILAVKVRIMHDIIMSVLQFRVTVPGWQSMHVTLSDSLICLLYRLHATAVPSYPGVRLRGGGNMYEGQVEVLECDSSPTQCTWKTVCSSNWDVIEASVTCRQLGLYIDNGR